MDIAIDRLLERARHTAESVRDRYPLYADPRTGEWISTKRGSWTAGFWLGLLWLDVLRSDGRRTEDVMIRLRRLAPRTLDDTVFRGMLFWYGAAAGERLLGQKAAGDIGVVAARELAKSFDAEHGLVPPGAMSGIPPTAGLLNIDAVGPLVGLLCWAGERTGDAALSEVAARHASAHLGHVPSPGLRPGTADGVWSRGIAWTMLAFAMAAEWLSEDYRDVADGVADWWCTTVFDHVPPSRFGTGRPLDTSAAAIAAVALLKLSALSSGRERYERQAEAIVHRLVTEHVHPIATRPDLVALGDGCYDTATAHELIWGDFFIVQALLILTGACSPKAI